MAVYTHVPAEEIDAFLTRYEGVVPIALTAVLVAAVTAWLARNDAPPHRWLEPLVGTRGSYALVFLGLLAPILALKLWADGKRSGR